VKIPGQIICSIGGGGRKKQQRQTGFTGVITCEDGEYVSLCPEVDVASQGRTVKEAQKRLLEAVKEYIEICFESNQPFLRPVPLSENPIVASPRDVVKRFQVRVGFDAKVYV
jgi:predicted RNase H-like HicB family nuclease